MYPIAGEIGNFVIRTYWIFVISGIFAGILALFLIIKNLERPEKIKTLILYLYSFIPFYVGARAGYLIETIAFKITPNSHAILGSASLLWGFLFAALFSIPAAKILKLDIWKSADRFAVPIAATAILVRIGCLFNGCCFGIPCSPEYFLGTYYPSITLAFEAYGNIALHPVPLYLTIAWTVILITLIILRKKVRFHGQFFLILSILYPIFRINIDFFRHHIYQVYLQPSLLILIFILIISVFFYTQQIRNLTK